MAVREEEPIKLQKRNPEIIEDASFYQDLTYISVMRQIEHLAKQGISVLKTQNEIGEYFKKYLEKKGFKVTNLMYNKYGEPKHKIEW